jgi:hypothetical protein
MNEPIIQPPGRVDDQDLEKESGQQSEVGEQTDLGISLDDRLLTVKDRENHRNRDRGGVI